MGSALNCLLRNTPCKLSAPRCLIVSACCIKNQRLRSKQDSMRSLKASASNGDRSQRTTSQSSSKSLCSTVDQIGAGKNSARASMLRGSEPDCSWPPPSMSLFQAELFYVHAPQKLVATEPMLSPDLNLLLLELLDSSHTVLLPTCLCDLFVLLWISPDTVPTATKWKWPWDHLSSLCCATRSVTCWLQLRNIFCMLH